MASRTFARLARCASPLASAAAGRAAPRASQFAHRGYASEAGGKKGGNTALYSLLGLGVAAGGASFYAYSNGLLSSDSSSSNKPGDYQAVYNAIARRLIDHDDYDDGSYGPVLLRLAWHASGTYDKATNTGGSNGATMRFAPESEHGANSGLKAARDFLEPVHQQFPWISYSDLWTLAGVCAIQEMQGPAIPWRPGRADRDLSFCSPDGRLPDASKEGKKGSSHLRDIFGRMGWNDGEIVALSGAHALGRCHADRSGFDGPWTHSPTVLTNDYYRLLLDDKWTLRRWDGPRQFEDSGSRSLMMLPTDLVLIQDKGFRPHVERYARDNSLFFRDFSAAVTRLFELGVPFASTPAERLRLKTLDEQEA